MEVISQRSSSSTLNPNAPMFIPFAYRTVEDFSDQWWSLIQSSPWFRDYWLQERYFDSQIDDFSLPDLDDLFDDEFQEEEEEEEKDEVSKEIVSMGSSKWKKGRAPFEKPRCVEKAPKIVNVRVSPRTIQQPRKFVKVSLLRRFDNALIMNKKRFGFSNVHFEVFGVNGNLHLQVDGYFFKHSRVIRNPAGFSNPQSLVMLPDALFIDEKHQSRRIFFSLRIAKQSFSLHTKTWLQVFFPSNVNKDMSLNVNKDVM
ncbi:hypothetical protein LWI28_000655 [Acer negundo]|uniref:Protein EARLY RESPONSIVE TO DEHYDRATION 15-like n=1 Tax=Acer negundo TaxID=4023 RepID=A0AAD5IB60_ACENE|nr:hypothetical protein LWI28_000655 [Acer negundo]